MKAVTVMATPVEGSAPLASDGEAAAPRNRAIVALTGLPL